MSKSVRGILANPHVGGDDVRRVWEKGALAAMDDHRRAGEPVVTWDWSNDRIVLVSADEVLQAAERYQFAEAENRLSGEDR